MKSIRSRAYKDRIAGLDDSVLALHSPDGPHGDILVSGSADGKIRSWNLQDKSKLFKLQLQKEGNQEISSFMFLGAVVFVGYTDGEIGAFDLNNASLVTSYKGHTGSVNSMVSYKEFIISGSQDCTVRKWQTEVGECQRSQYFGRS